MSEQSTIKVMTVKDLKELLENVDETFNVAISFSDYDFSKDIDYERYLGVEEEVTINFKKRFLYIRGSEE